MSNFSPDAINASSDVISSPLRNNFNKLQTLLNGGLGDDQFADNTLSGLKLKDGTIAISKTALGTYTAWAAWTPTWTGFSVDPTATARCCQIGKVGFVELACSIGGTSNATTITITLPFTAKSNGQRLCSQTFNNGGLLPDPAQIVLAGGSATVDIYKDATRAVWTASGGKYVNFAFSYEIN